MKTSALWLPLVVTAIVASCSNEESKPQTTVTVHDTVTATSRIEVPQTSAAIAPTQAPPTDMPPSSAGASQTWIMPDLTGRNLQAAQDAIQAMTNNAVVYSSSTDLTGQGRNQVMDRNWRVCSSTPPPGAVFDASTPVDFGVVRIDTENCP